VASQLFIPDQLIRKNNSGARPSAGRAGDNPPRGGGTRAARGLKWLCAQAGFFGGREALCGVFLTTEKGLFGAQKRVPGSHLNNAGHRPDSQGVACRFFSFAVSVAGDIFDFKD